MTGDPNDRPTHRICKVCGIKAIVLHGEEGWLSMCECFYPENLPEGADEREERLRARVHRGTLLDRQVREIDEID